LKKHNVGVDVVSVGEQ